MTFLSYFAFCVVATDNIYFPRIDGVICHLHIDSLLCLEHYRADDLPVFIFLHIMDYD